MWEGQRGTLIVRGMRAVVPAAVFGCAGEPVNACHVVCFWSSGFIRTSGAGQNMGAGAMWDSGHTWNMTRLTSVVCVLLCFVRCLTRPISCFVCGNPIKHAANQKSKAF